MTLAAVSLLVGIGVTEFAASASSSPKPFYACLARGKLTQVGKTAPSCPQGAKVISWNQVGPSGLQGEVGPKGDAGPAGGPKGDTGPPGPPGTGSGVSVTSQWAEPTSCVPQPDIENLSGPSLFSYCSISATMSLAAGSYVLEIPKTTGGGIDGSKIGQCQAFYALAASGSATVSNFQMGYRGYGNAPQLVTVGEGGGQVTLSCDARAQVFVPIPTGPYGIAMVATPTVVQ